MHFAGQDLITDRFFLKVQSPKLTDHVYTDLPNQRGERSEHSKIGRVRRKTPNSDQSPRITIIDRCCPASTLRLLRALLAPLDFPGRMDLNLSSSVVRSFALSDFIDVDATLGPGTKRLESAARFKLGETCPPCNLSFM